MGETKWEHVSERERGRRILEYVHKAQQGLKCHSVCARVLTSLCVSEHVSCVYVMYVCVCVWNRREDPILRLCQHREDDRMQHWREKFFKSTIMPMLHPTTATRAYKCFLLKLQNLERKSESSLLPLHRLHDVYYAYTVARGKKYFFVICYDSAFLTMLTSIY